MRKLKRVMAFLLVMTLCAANVIQPLHVSAEEIYVDESETSMETKETESGETSTESNGNTENGPDSLVVTESQSESESVGESESESESESETESQTESESETGLESEPIVKYRVEVVFSGPGQVKITDSHGNVFNSMTDSDARDREYEEGERLQLKTSADPGYEISEMDIYKSGRLDVNLKKDTLKTTEKADFDTEICVDSDVRIEVKFEKKPEETESKKESETVKESETEKETVVETESKTETEKETVAKTESKIEKDEFETDGKLSFVENMEADTLSKKLENEILPMALGQQGQVWGMYAIFANANVIIDEFMPGFQSNDYSKIIQTGPTLSENTMTGYCIQFGVACPPGGYVTESNLTASQKNLLGYALEFGWKQNGNAYDEAQYADYTNRTEYAVTQAIIWACSQNKFGTDVGEAAINKVIQNTFDPAHAASYYNQLKSQILSAETIPSFSSRDQGSAATIILKWSENNKRYEASVSDTNGVLSRYNYSYPGITISRNGNTATIYTTGNYPDGVVASAVYTTAGGSNAAVLWDGENGNQDLATYQQASADIYSYIRIATEGVGNIELYKKSSNPSLTNGNSCYSLAGAVYGIYNGSNQEVGRITTDANGYGKLSNLPAGSYRVKEITAPKGYAIDLNSHNVTVTGGSTATVNVTDYPQSDPVSIILGKVDRQTNADKPAGSASLEGAEFTVKYYSVQSDTDPAAGGNKPMRTWVLKTNGNGKTLLAEKYKVSGDDFYLLNGVPTLPIGTITIQETKAPVGYLLNSEVYVRKITSDGDAEKVETYNAPTIPEQVIRGNFEFIKNSEDGKAMANIPFKISSKTTGENYTVYSDKDGHVTTKGLSFAGGSGLPYDTYIVEEVACIENEDKVLISPFEVEITENNVTRNLGIIKNDYLPFPELDSVALGRETGDHTLPAEGGVAINETIAVAGCCRRIGTTTQALQIIKYILLNGCRACYIQMNDYGFVEKIASYYTDVLEDKEMGRVTYENIDMYYNLNRLPDILNMEYEYYIYDCGVYEQDDFNKISFLEKNIKIIVGGSKVNEIEYMTNAISTTYHTDVKYIFNYIEDVKDTKNDIIELMDNLEERTYFAPYAPNSFRLSPEYSIYDSMIQCQPADGSLPIKKKKFSLFRRK